jgi:hypothetical protein
MASSACISVKGGSCSTNNARMLFRGCGEDSRVVNYSAVQFGGNGCSGSVAQARLKRLGIPFLNPSCWQTPRIAGLAG